jgi:hypothetical protein
MLDVNGTWQFQLVDAESAEYPVPTWAERDCTEETNSCSSHGACNSTGYCVCDPGYYGSGSCELYCDGDIVANTCRPNTILYIGGMVAYDNDEAEEYKANMRLAVELINNKTDGWFDDSTSQIYLIMQLNNSGCDSTQAMMCLDYQNDWSIEHQGVTLDGLIGAECSAGRSAFVLILFLLLITCQPFHSINRKQFDAASDLVQIFHKGIVGQGSVSLLCSNLCF